MRVPLCDGEMCLVYISIGMQYLHWGLACRVGLFCACAQGLMQRLHC